MFIARELFKEFSRGLVFKKAICYKYFVTISSPMGPRINSPASDL